MWPYRYICRYIYRYFWPRYNRFKDRHCERNFFCDEKHTVTHSITVIITVMECVTRYRGRVNFGDALREFIIVTDIVTNNVTHYSYRHIQRYFNRYFYHYFYRISNHYRFKINLMFKIKFI